MRCATDISAKRTPLILAVILLISTIPARAALFQISENSASGLGNAFAGGAAIAEDTSTVWYNPAGLTRIPGSQLAVVANFVAPSSTFEDAGSTTVLGAPLTGGGGGNLGETVLIPNFYYTRQINERVTFGVALNAPFGLITDYDDAWKGRYYALRSEITTLNINPAVGYKINDKLSIGGGVNVQYAKVKFTNAIDFGTICFAALGAGSCGGLGVAPQGNDGKSTLDVDSVGFGYNLGLLWQAGQNTRVGVQYRSKVDQDLEGDLDVATLDPGAAAVAAAAGIVNSGAKADVTLPATASVSVFHRLNPKWAIMGDITQTRWSSLPELRVMFDSGQPDGVITLGLDNSERYSFGATYTPSERWTYRFGIAFDETPVPNAELRPVRLPDEDRTWLTFGLGYRRNERLSFDFAYAYIDVKSTQLNKIAGAPGSENFFNGNLVGQYNSTNFNILSAQVNWKFKTR
jgi:long-chain fatty acid transport protein